MKEDDFNFDEFMENSNSDFEMKLEEYKDRMIRLAIETNYAQIEKNLMTIPIYDKTYIDLFKGTEFAELVLSYDINDLENSLKSLILEIQRLEKDEEEYKKRLDKFDADTKDLAKAIMQADLVVAAAGKPGLIKGEWIKPGAIVIDIGVHVAERYAGNCTNYCSRLLQDFRVAPLADVRNDLKVCGRCGH